MGFTDDWYTDERVPLVRSSVIFSPADVIAVTDGISPSVKLDNVVVKVRWFWIFPRKKRKIWKRRLRQL
jgi:hypothetical protein